MALLIDISRYTLQRATSSRCGTCGASLHMLCERARPDGTLPLPGAPGARPWFYLCVACGASAQIGVGPLNGPEPGRHAHA